MGSERGRGSDGAEGQGGEGGLPAEPSERLKLQKSGGEGRRKNRNTRWSEERHSGMKRLVLGSPASFKTDVFSSTAIKERRPKDSHWIPVRDDEKSGSEVERREEEKGRGVLKKKNKLDCLNFPSCSLVEPPHRRVGSKQQKSGI